MYKDISSYYGVVDGLDILCEDDSAILNGFINILNTLKDKDNISERVFRPNIGSSLHTLIFDPLDNLTTFQIKMALEDIAKQITRATFVNNETVVAINQETQSFDIKLVLRNSVTGNLITGFFTISNSN